MKTIIKRCIAAMGRLPVVENILLQPLIRTKIQQIPGGYLLYGSGWERQHPFDRIHGTDTSGVCTVEDLPEHESARAHANLYAGSQPSIMRAALSKLPPVDTCTFLDLGCGKGRPLIVASEFPFRDIIGVELSPPLAEVARRNIDIIAHRFPQRTPVKIEIADASTFPLPSGDVTLFLYNPFGAELVEKVVSGVEAALTEESRSIYIVYYNPIAGNCFDASPLLHRRFVGTMPYDLQELGYGPDSDDPVVIWQGGTALPPPTEPVNAKIEVVSYGNRAILAM